MTAHPFPRARWLAVIWLAVWVPSYAAHWGWLNFVWVCDIAVIVSCWGFILGSPLLLSAQALATFVLGAAWTLGMMWRLLLGSHLMSGTEYMFDVQIPMSVRLLSTFHLILPISLAFALRRVGYDRRALRLQLAIHAAATLAAATTGKNLNFVMTDPIFGLHFGPAPIHILIIVLSALVFIYLPTHFALVYLMPSSSAAPTRQSRESERNDSSTRNDDLNAGSAGKT